VGQKVNPIGLRVGVIRTWESRWFAKGKLYADQLHEDLKLRKFLKKKLKHASVSNALKIDLQKMTDRQLYLDIQEVRKPDVDAQLVAETIAMKLEKRTSWRRALKYSIAAAIRGGVRGIKVQVSGRLDGAEIARTEWYTEKSVPLHTLRADIDYGTAEALTTYGIIGLKVWIYKGDVLSAREVEEASRVKS